MSNALAIARQEVTRHLRSPFSWALLGVFAIVSGGFYVTALGAFIDGSQDAILRGGPISANQLLVRPFLLNVVTVVLFVLPLVTMSACSGERMQAARVWGGSAVTDYELALGAWLGVLAVYAVMLFITLVDVAALVAYGRPEWRWVAASYLGLLLMGGALAAVGVAISSIAGSPLVSAMLTLGLSLLLWTMKWIVLSSPAALQATLAELSFVDRFDDFAKGVVDTGHLVYYLSIVLFGLLLAAYALGGRRAAAPELSDHGSGPR